MGKNISSLAPKYVKNFNIENRAAKKIQNMEKYGDVTLPPRHPSTAAMLKEMEKSAPKVDEKRVNENIADITKKVKVYSKGQNDDYFKGDKSDKRPKKENEYRNLVNETVDIDYERFGYAAPAYLNKGNITLRQFDMIINEYKQKKNQDKEIISKLCTEYDLDATNLHILLEYYKPFHVLSKSNKLNKEKDSESLLGNVFPNLNQITSQANSGK